MFGFTPPTSPIKKKKPADPNIAAPTIAQQPTPPPTSGNPSGFQGVGPGIGGGSPGGAPTQGGVAGAVMGGQTSIPTAKDRAPSIEEMQTPPAMGDQGAATQTASNGEPIDAEPKDIDQMIEDFVRKQLSGEANTAEEEALIRELMGQDIGAGRVGNRASMGRAGFASSGAEAAMGADIERAARQSATQDILGLRRDASQQAIDNALAAGGLDIQERDAAIRQRQAEAQILALQALLGGEGVPGADGAPPAEAGADLPGSPTEAVTGIVDPDGNGVAQAPGFNERPGFDGEGARTQSADEAVAAGDAARTMQTASAATERNALDAAPAGYEATGETRIGSDGTTVYTQYSNGTDTVWVRG